MSKSLATWFTPSLQTISRSAGRSAVAAAAYRACVKLIDQTTGLIHDYTKKKGHVETILIGASDISELWNKAELAETRKNSTVARELMPHCRMNGQMTSGAHASATSRNICAIPTA